MSVVNFAHGEFYTLGAYAAFAALAWAGLPFVAALLAAIAAGALLGALCERALLRPLRGHSIDTIMLVMIGVWIAMQNAELLAWGGVARSIPHPFPTAPLTLGPLNIAPLRLFVVLTAAALIGLAWLLIQKTRLGTAMRATFQDRDTAALMGVPIGKIHTVTFAFGAALAAAAGALLGPVFLAYPSMGDLASLKAFSVVILGGLGNLAGATLGGLLLGVAEELGAGYVSSGYRDAVGVVAIILVLLFRPAGLFALASGLAGWAIGRLALKLRGAYFVLVTISFAGVISLVSINWMDLTNGPLGLPGVPPPALGPWTLRTKNAYWYLVLAGAALTYLVCHRLVTSRIGRALVALRENEPLAESVGIDGTRYLVLAAVVSAAMAGLAGSLYAHYTRFVSPEVFLFSYTVTMVIMVIAGGQGTLAGPVVGALLFTVLPEALREAVAWQWQMLAYGVVLVLFVFFLPRGIVPTLAAWRRR